MVVLTALAALPSKCPSPPLDVAPQMPPCPSGLFFWAALPPLCPWGAIFILGRYLYNSQSGTPLALADGAVSFPCPTRASPTKKISLVVPMGLSISYIFFSTNEDVKNDN